MPAPSRTSLAEIIAAGRAVLAREGLNGLTMQGVGEMVGVRAPSLYKHVPSRSALIRLVAADVVDEVGRLLAAAATSGKPDQDLRALALTLRSFAHRDPHGYDVLFMPLPEDAAPDVASFAAAVEPVLRVAAEIAGADHALYAARTLTAWASGFLRMELAGDFQLGGDVDEAFEFGLQALSDGLSRARSGPR